MACSLATGSAPGSPRQTSHVRVLGGSPKDSSQPQNIFVAVCSWTWISRPMTASKSVTGAPRVEADGLLERMARVEDAVLAERRAGELEADREVVGQPARDRDRRDPGQRHRRREVVVEVHGQRVVALGSQLEGDAGARRSRHEVDALERLAEVV